MRHAISDCRKVHWIICAAEMRRQRKIIRGVLSGERRDEARSLIIINGGGGIVHRR